MDTFLLRYLSWLTHGPFGGDGHGLQEDLDDAGSEPRRAPAVGVQVVQNLLDDVVRVLRLQKTHKPGDILRDKTESAGEQTNKQTKTKCIFSLNKKIKKGFNVLPFFGLNQVLGTYSLQLAHCYFWLLVFSYFMLASSVLLCIPLSFRLLLIFSQPLTSLS